MGPWEHVAPGRAGVRSVSLFKMYVTAYSLKRGIVEVDVKPTFIKLLLVSAAVDMAAPTEPAVVQHGPTPKGVEDQPARARVDGQQPTRSVEGGPQTAQGSRASRATDTQGRVDDGTTQSMDTRGVGGAQQAQAKHRSPSYYRGQRDRLSWPPVPRRTTSGAGAVAPALTDEEQAWIEAQMNEAHETLPLPATSVFARGGAAAPTAVVAQGSTREPTATELNYSDVSLDGRERVSEKRSLSTRDAGAVPAAPPGSSIPSAWQCECKRNHF